MTYWISRVTCDWPSCKEWCEVEPEWYKGRPQIRLVAPWYALMSSGSYNLGDADQPDMTFCSEEHRTLYEQARSAMVPFAVHQNANRQSLYGPQAITPP